jgi:hypothetical protein
MLSANRIRAKKSRASSIWQGDWGTLLENDAPWSPVVLFAPKPPLALPDSPLRALSCELGQTSAGRQGF